MPLHATSELRVSICKEKSCWDFYSFLHDWYETQTHKKDREPCDTKEENEAYSTIRKNNFVPFSLYHSQFTLTNSGDVWSDRRPYWLVAYQIPVASLHPPLNKVLVLPRPRNIFGPIDYTVENGNAVFLCLVLFHGSTKTKQNETKNKNAENIKKKNTLVCSSHFYKLLLPTISQHRDP